MMYVVFIHCLYWVGLFNGRYSSILKSLFLIEMPLFFFIAGASNSLSKKRPVLSFYISRFQRILLPYWIYGLICITLTYIATVITPIEIEQEKYFAFNFPLVFVPVSKIGHMTGVLWFIPVYLYVIFLFPLFEKYYGRYKNSNAKYVPLIILPILLMNNGWEELSNAKMVIFYSFWVYAGLFFQELKINEPIKSKLKIIPVIVFCAILVLRFILTNHSYANMQTNKFPPNIVFFFYTFGALLTFYLFSKYIINTLNYLRRSKVFNWIYKQYIQNCYTIYLYHLPSFFVIDNVFKHLGIRDYLFSNQWICLTIYILLTIPINAVIGKLFSWAEKIKIINR
ncbi:MAG: hypothetical protein Ta2A_00440 [Treponemataceae bacterium]|nr:MAG: hypothetical protein Ta2A_00440 [Treponemataceae bacterium]